MHKVKKKEGKGVAGNPAGSSPGDWGPHGAMALDQLGVVDDGL